MNIKSVLKNFNLKSIEIDVYLAVLKLGKASASQVAKSTNIKRTYIYDIAKSLEQKGLLTITFHKKKKQFVAQSPEKFKELQQENLKLLEQILPELKSMQRTTGIKPVISFYEGFEGIKKINEDFACSGPEIVGFATDKFITAEEGELAKQLIKKRLKCGVTARFIGPVSEGIKVLVKNDKKENRQTKMIPQDLFKSDIEIVIYSGNKVAITNYKQEFGLIIESSDIAIVLKQLFEMIWRGGFVID